MKGAMEDQSQHNDVNFRSLHLSPLRKFALKLKNLKFSFRKLWMFSGPGLLMSIAFLDPGNIEADLQTGNATNYKLLWVFLWSTVLGLVMQRLSARLGVVTGEHLSEICHKRYPTLPRIFLWLMMEIAIIGSDMQEVIGTAIAFYLVSNKKIPLYGGVLITVADTFLFLLLDKFGVRKLELFFALLISIMAITFGYEYIVVFPDQEKVIKGLVIPWCNDCNSKALLMAVGVIGATIMPHNLYLHSALVKSRQVDIRNKEAVREANKYYFIESTIALAVSLVINIFVVSVFADGLYGKTNRQVLHTCMKTDIPDRDIFPNDTNMVDPDMYTAGIFLGCEFGLVPMYIWAVGLYASGQSSTMTGTYSGQFVMEGFLHLKWARWKRVLLTRSIAILPTVMVAAFHGIGDLTNMNDFLNVVMSIQLPFALFPTIAFTSSKHVMNEFRNGIFTITIATLLTVGIIAINLYFVYDFSSNLKEPAAFMALGAFLLFYIVFVLYLIGHFLSALGLTKLNALPLIGPYLAEPEQLSLTENSSM